MKNKKSILIIGGSGFIGSHLAKKCLKGMKVIIVSRRKIFKNKRNKLIKYINFDISNKKNFTKLKKYKIDYVVNCGGNVNHFEKKETYQSHFIGVKNLFDYFKKKNIKKFIQIGSSSEYGKIPSPQKEIKLGKPKMIYGKSKMKASKFLLKKFKTNKFPVVILRLYQVYGPNQSINRLIPFVIYSSLKDKVFPCSSGFQKRDFLFIDDVISAIMLALKKSKCNGKIINIGFGKSYKVKNIINFILKSIKKGKPNFDKIKLRIDEGKDIYPDISLAKRTLNWKPKLNIKKGLLKTINFYKKKND